jgi:hypothetical protein
MTLKQNLNLIGIVDLKKLLGQKMNIFFNRDRRLGVQKFEKHWFRGKS